MHRIPCCINSSVPAVPFHRWKEGGPDVYTTNQQVAIIAVGTGRRKFMARTLAQEISAKSMQATCDWINSPREQGIHFVMTHLSVIQCGGNQFILVSPFINIALCRPQNQHTPVGRHKVGTLDSEWILCSPHTAERIS